MSDELAWQERQDEKEWESKQAENAYENFIIETEQDWRRYEARIRELTDRVAELEAENVKLKAERRWIPCTEQMPKDNEYVLVYCSADGFYNIDCLYDGSWLEAADYYEEDVIVTHWMPLPESPEVKDE
jgi:hypothetical protein